MLFQAELDFFEKKTFGGPHLLIRAGTGLLNHLKKMMHSSNSTVGGDGLCSKLCCAFTTSLVDALAEAFVTHIHLS